MSPAASSGRMSAVAKYAHTSASASSGSTSSVQATPTGSRPISSPASTPTFSADETTTPASSRSGRAMTMWRPSRPTLPVPQTMMRVAIAS